MGETAAHDARGAGGTGTEAPGATPDDRPLVIFLGDSLTAGFGLSEDEAFPARLGARLEKDGLPVRVVNAGVSGDTTAGGLARLDWLLRQKPEVLVVELGANDGLRGLSIEECERNLREIVTRAQRSGASVLLLGMLVPPTLGEDYFRGFARVYPRLGRETRTPLVPFFLEGVAGRADLNQADGIHPTAAGHEKLAENIYPSLRDLVERLRR